MNTCDKCINYIRSDEGWVKPELAAKYKDRGSCKLFGDENDFNDGPTERNDVCYGWDYESYKAGVTVMAKFGCIHWKEKK